MTEGQRQAAELVRILKRTGRYNVNELARRTGRPRRSLCRALNGGQVSVAYVQELALAAGVSPEFLLPERPGARIPQGLRLLLT